MKTLWVAGSAERNSGLVMPIDPKTAKPGAAIKSKMRTTCTSLPTALPQSLSPKPLKRLEFRDPQTMKFQYNIQTPDCAGINHADFSIDGKFAVFTCEFSGANWQRSIWFNAKSAVI
jgi:hypothetical protein